jgi:hypothetical protein
MLCADSTHRKETDRWLEGNQKVSTRRRSHA